MIVRDALPAELAEVGEIRVSAYRAGGHISPDSGYAPVLRALGAADDGTVLVAVAGQGTGQDRGRGTGQDGGRDTGQDRGRGTGQDGGRGTGQDGGRDTGQDRGRDTGQDRGRDTGQDRGRGTGQDGGRGTGQDGGRDTGQDRGRDTGQDRGRGTGQDGGRDTGQDRGPILGTVMLQYWPQAGHVVVGPGEAEIRALAVSPDGQGRGTGRALLRAVIDRAAQTGVRHLVLLTQPDMRRAAHMYQQAGFRRLPDRDWSPEPGLTLLAYGMELTAAAAAAAAG